MYYSVDPFLSQKRFSQFWGTALALVPDPFLVSAYNLILVYLRDLTASHKLLAKANRFAGVGEQTRTATLSYCIHTAF